jgi:outer membrane protein
MVGADFSYVKISCATALGLLLMLSASTGRADSEANNSVEAGLYYLHFYVNADDISGPYVPPGVNLGIKDIETLYLSYRRRLSSHFDLGLSMGYPPRAQAEGKGPAALGSVPYNDRVIITTRAFAPTLYLKYNFLDESSAWQPYIGAGVNYTRFYDRDSTAAGNAVMGGPTSITLPASVGPAGTIGIRCRLDRHWSWDASYAASIVDTRLTANTEGFLRTSHIELNPRALVIAGGYSF